MESMARTHAAVEVQVDALASAVAAGCYDSAEAALAAMGASLPPEALGPAAELHIQRGRWREAARLLSRIVDRDVATEMKRNLARNMAAMQRHRPAVFEALDNAEPRRTYHIVAGAGGQAVVCHVMEDGRQVSLTPGNAPKKAMDEALGSLADVAEEGQAIGLCGIGDGYLLGHLAHHPPRLVHGMQQVVHLYEPDAQLVRVVMLLHDFTGPQGPIEQMRFQWYLGPTWQKQFTEHICADLHLPAPAATVSQSLDIDAIHLGMKAASEAYAAVDQQFDEQIQAYYAGLPADHFQQIFADRPPRPPRVLLLTTRFSSVLQYSTRDAAHGMAQCGWETRILIEPSDYHGQPRPAVRHAVAEFKPDLIFQIDHHRHEHEGVFPDKLPFVCWIQDHLPNLTSEEVGRKLGLRDYVLTAVAPMYSGIYQYPRRQCIDLSKLTRVPKLPVRWRSRGDDLAFVSNASQVPAALAEQLENAIQPFLEDLTLIREVCRRMIRLYDEGGSLATAYEVRRFYARCERDTGRFLTHGEARDRLLRILTEKLNNALYRQQALQWAADIAAERGLTFSLYGTGWEEHGQFAPYARGVVKYGEDLEELTRNTRINLQIVPYHCMHQRLLDGLVAGGFFLVRSHPYDHLTQELSDYIDAHNLHAVRDIHEAFDLLDKAKHEQFQQLLFRCACLSEFGDVVALVQAWRQAKLLLPGKPALPHLAEVAFDSKAALAQRIDRFIEDDAARTEIRQAQRLHVADRLSYTAGMQRVVRAIAERLNTESA